MFAQPPNAPASAEVDLLTEAVFADPPNTGGNGNDTSADAADFAELGADFTSGADAVQAAGVAGDPTKIRRYIRVLRKAERKQWDKERKHLNACGKQVCSARRTSPVIAFKGASTGRLPQPDRIILVEKRAEPAAIALPTPPAGGGCGGGSTGLAGKATVSRGSRSKKSFSVGVGAFATGDKYVPWTAHRGVGDKPGKVLRGWSTGRRFLTDPAPAAPARHGAAVIHSTHASPFSPTYPYEEPVIPAPPPAIQTIEDNLSAEAELAAVPEEADPSQDRSPLEKPLGPQATVDRNELYMKYQHRPPYTFGRADVGFRFKPGTQVSRRAPFRTTSRLMGFRDLRDQLPPGMPPPAPPPPLRPHGSGVIAAASTSAAAAAAAAPIVGASSVAGGPQ